MLKLQKVTFNAASYRQKTQEKASQFKMRNKTKNFIGGTFLLAIIAIAVIPKVVGVVIQDAANTNLLELIPPEARNQLSITENRFDSGWFHSSALFDVDYSPSGAIPGRLSITVQIALTIQHGPILFTPQGLELGLVYAQIIPKLNGGELESALAQLPFTFSNIDLDLMVGFDQSVRLGLDIASINYSDNQGHLIFDGLSGSFVSHRDNSAEFMLSLGKLEAEEITSSIGFSLSGLQLTSATSQLSDVLAPSNAVLTIPSISSGTPYPFRIDGILAESRLRGSTSGPAQTNIYQRVEISSIESEFPLSSVSWVSEINEIQNDLLQRYFELLSDMQAQIRSGSNAIVGNSQINQLGQNLILVLMQNRLVFNNRINVEAYDGGHSIDLSISWEGLPDLNNIARLNINDAINALTLRLDVSFDLAAVMRSPAAELVDPYVQQQYIKLDNGRVLLNGSVEDGKIVVNGDAIPLDQLF
jgi:hypothetical protein